MIPFDWLAGWSVRCVSIDRRVHSTDFKQQRKIPNIWVDRRHFSTVARARNGVAITRRTWFGIRYSDRCDSAKSTIFFLSFLLTSCIHFIIIWCLAQRFLNCFHFWLLDVSQTLPLLPPSQRRSDRYAIVQRECFTLNWNSAPSFHFSGTGETNRTTTNDRSCKQKRKKNEWKNNSFFVVVAWCWPKVCRAQNRSSSAQHIKMMIMLSPLLLLLLLITVYRGRYAPLHSVDRQQRTKHTSNGTVLRAKPQNSKQ